MTQTGSNEPPVTNEPQKWLPPVQTASATFHNAGTAVQNVKAGEAVAGSSSAPSLGETYDGSAELVPEMGGMADKAFAAFGEIVVARQMPGVTQRRVTLRPTTLGFSNERPYYLLQQANGATVAIYIAHFGHDLYMSWTLFIRPVLNWIVIGIIAAVAFLTGFLPGAALSGALAIPSFILSFILWSLPVGIVGSFLKGSFTAFFIRQLNMFDAEDIRAMCMVTHRSLLEAADTVGIQLQILSRKEQFFGGRRDRLI